MESQKNALRIKFSGGINGFHLQQSAIAEEFNFAINSIVSGSTSNEGSSHNNNDLKRKTPPIEESSGEKKGQNSQSGSAKRKAKLVWDGALQQRFLDAVESLGPNKCVPKKIVELMNVPGLTRTQVGSHLQKHRITQKRRADKVPDIQQAGDTKGLSRYTSRSSFPLGITNPYVPTINRNSQLFYQNPGIYSPGSFSISTFPHNINTFQGQYLSNYGRLFNKGPSGSRFYSSTLPSTWTNPGGISLGPYNNFRCQTLESSPFIPTPNRINSKLQCLNPGISFLGSNNIAQFPNQMSNSIQGGHFSYADLFKIGPSGPRFESATLTSTNWARFEGTSSRASARYRMDPSIFSLAPSNNFMNQMNQQRDYFGLGGWQKSEGLDSWGTGPINLENSAANLPVDQLDQHLECLSSVSENNIIDDKELSGILAELEGMLLPSSGQPSVDYANQLQGQGLTDQSQVEIGSTSAQFNDTFMSPYEHEEDDDFVASLFASIAFEEKQSLEDIFNSGPKANHRF